MTAAILAPLPFPVNSGPFALSISSRRGKFPVPVGRAEATRSFPSRTRVRLGNETADLQRGIEKIGPRNRKPCLDKAQDEGTVTLTDFVSEKTPQPQPKQVFTR